MKLKEWSMFVLLGLVWGSSFLWIKIAVQEIGPFWRLLIGSLLVVAGIAVVNLKVRFKSAPLTPVAD